MNKRVYRHLSLLGFSALLVSCIASQAQDGGSSWSFNPKPDDFRADALLDLRSLNEKVAGESGFVRASADGDFVLGNGKPVRFWAVNTGTGHEKPFTPRPQGRKTEPDLARHARFLAKRGVNMVRLHLQMSPNLEKNPNAALTDINTDERDYAWRAVAAMRKEGIYTTLSPYWGVPMKFSPSWGIAGGDKQSALGLLYFDPQLQTAYKSWLKKILAEPNPYTGIPLVKDPALAIFQIQNEDSLLFWTVGNIAGPQKQRLEKLFGDFLTKKYGSLAKAQTAWMGDRAGGDNPSAGSMELLPIWEMTQARTGGRHVRLSDQTQFFGDTMRAFNQMIVDYVRKDLGGQMLVNPGNWRTADTVRLNDVERWSYLPGEVDAVNRYYGGVHKGPHEGWAIVNGDKFTSDSALLDPRGLPINLRQTAGRPMMVTESGWIMPNGFASEGPFLISAYSSLTGVDTFFWFSTSDDEWTPPTSGNGYLPSQAKWLFGNPDMLGSFPAAAYMFRQGLVKKGEPTVVEERSLANLWERRTPLLAEEPGFDPNRDAGDIAPTSSVKTGLSPLTYLTGPVTVKFGGDPAQTKLKSLGGQIDGPMGIIKSSTGELTLNSDKGFCTVNAPQAQGVAAHFGRQAVHRLTDVTVSSRNQFGSVLVLSMDGQPIKTSGKILVQVATQSRPTGWQEVATRVPLDGGKTVPGYEVRSFGGAPWRVQLALVDVIVRNPALTKATVLDMNGNGIGSGKLAKVEGGVRLTFPENAMYVILQ
ncbi:MAG: hypothetical protein ACOYON_02465 [Fimbriimonas sp.]